MCTPRERLRTFETNNPVGPIRVGFLGTGYIADWHAKALSTIPAVSLDAVCDKDKPRAQAFGQRYGVSQCYESLEAMLDDAELASTWFTSSFLPISTPARRLN